jgi:hypothetical protein
MKQIETFWAYMLSPIAHLAIVLWRLYLRHRLNFHKDNAALCRRNVEREHNGITYHTQKAAAIERMLLQIEYARLLRSGTRFMHRADTVKRKLDKLTGERNGKKKEGK